MGVAGTGHQAAKVKAGTTRVIDPKTGKQITLAQQQEQGRAETAAKREAEQKKAAADAAAKLKAEQDAAARAEAERQKKIQDEANPLHGLSDEQLAEYGRNAAIEKRYGGEFSWLDPSFQMNPQLLGQSATASAQADPNAVAAQWAGLGRANELMRQNLNFQDPAAQQGILNEWQQVQGGRGAPQFAGDADQRRVLEQALGFASNTGPGSLQFDNGARQQEQYGNLQGIIAGGGATSIEMADRARQRGDSEAWLRGQREADMADYAERGLTGSGMELQALAADRQSAAGRNSLADLEMAKALEERRLSAINSAGGLATDMRGQTIQEQGLLNSRSSTGLSAASSVANSMRGADYNEKTYLDERTLDALRARDDLTSKMRDQQYTEQIGNRTAQQNALNSFNDTASGMRNQSFTEAETRANASDKWAELNAEITNKTRADNVSFLQDQYDQTQERKMDRWREILRTKTSAAQDLMNFDQKDNYLGSASAANLAGADAEAWNKAMAAYRQAMGIASDQSGVLDAKNDVNKRIEQTGATGGAVVDEIVKGVTGGGAIDAATQVAGKQQGLTNSGSTSQASILPQNFDLEELKKYV